MSDLISGLARQAQLEAEVRLLDQIMGILRRHNPLGLDIATHPEDYRPEANSILTRLRSAGPAVADVRAIVYEEFSNWRGAERAGAPERFDAVAQDIHSAAGLRRG